MFWLHLVGYVALVVISRIFFDTRSDTRYAVLLVSKFQKEVDRLRAIVDYANKTVVEQNSAPYEYRETRRILLSDPIYNSSGSNVRLLKRGNRHLKDSLFLNANEKDILKLALNLEIKTDSETIQSNSGQWKSVLYNFKHGENYFVVEAKRLQILNFDHHINNHINVLDDSEWPLLSNNHISNESVGDIENVNITVFLLKITKTDGSNKTFTDTQIHNDVALPIDNNSFSPLNNIKRFFSKLNSIFKRNVTSYLQILFDNQHDQNKCFYCIDWNYFKNYSSSMLESVVNYVGDSVIARSLQITSFQHHQIYEADEFQFYNKYLKKWSADSVVQIFTFFVILTVSAITFYLHFKNKVNKLETENFAVLQEFSSFKSQTPLEMAKINRILFRIRKDLNKMQEINEMALSQCKQGVDLHLKMSNINLNNLKIVFDMLESKLRHSMEDRARDVNIDHEHEYLTYLMSHSSQKDEIEHNTHHTVGLKGDNTSTVNVLENAEIKENNMFNGHAQNDSSDSSSCERIPISDKMKSMSHPCFNHRQSLPQQKSRRKWTIQQK